MLKLISSFSHRPPFNIEINFWEKNASFSSFLYYLYFFFFSKPQIFFRCGFFKEFMKKLEEKRGALNKAISMGEDILTNSHPDSITTVKHWNTIIKARFEEVSSQRDCCRDRRYRLITRCLILQLQRLSHFSKACI